MMQHRARGNSAVFPRKEKGVFRGWKVWLPAWNNSLSHAPPPLEPRPGGGRKRNKCPQPSQGLHVPGHCPAKRPGGAAVAVSGSQESHRLGGFGSLRTNAGSGSGPGLRHDEWGTLGSTDSRPRVAVCLSWLPFASL